MVSPSKTLLLGRLQASLICSRLIAFFMVLDSLRPTTSGGRHPAFLSLMIDIARVVQGERRAELARAMLSRSPHSQSISLMLCKDTIFLVRFQILPFDLERFSAQIRRIDVFNIEDAHARQNSCEHGSALA